LSEDWYLWMFVYNYEEWFPVNPIYPFEGKWSSNVYLNPDKRDIAVVLVDKDANSEFKQISSIESFLISLPEGAKVSARITVEV
jgi:hypothetical protein